MEFLHENCCFVCFAYWLFQSKLLDFYFVLVLTAKMPPKKDENKANFIEAVREFPFLYDLKDSDYKNKTKVDEKWTELATDFNYKGKFLLFAKNFI